MKYPYKVLGLSQKASATLSAIKAGIDTPLQISKETNISRPAIYAILEKLEEQGLVVQVIRGKSKVWTIASTSQVNKLFEQAQEDILGSKTEKEILYDDSDIYIKVYRGKQTITALMKHIFQEHKSQKCIGIQGDNVYEGWKDLLGIETINEVNKSIKKNGLINQAIVPEGHFERAVSLMGSEWTKHFEGRSYRVNEIDQKYFSHKGEMFLFKDKAYLISMSEELVIEIKHSHIQQMLMSLIEYVQDSSRVVDGNEALRKLMELQANKKTSK